MSLQDDKLHEECGVCGAWFPPASAETEQEGVGPERPLMGRLLYYGLLALQHRGQESAGIATNGAAPDAGASTSAVPEVKASSALNFTLEKGMGLVSEVFSAAKLEVLDGNIGIGHTRYSTAGNSILVNAQPLTGHSKQGPLSVVHNGNLTNADIIRELLEESGNLFRTESDSEVILNLVARSAVKKGVAEAVWDATQAIQGSFALIVMTSDTMIGARDRNGIRPLCIGTLEDGYLLASESCALDAVGAEFLRDVAPGEIVVINPEGLHSLRGSERTRTQTCSFEYIYFARPDSVVDGKSVYEMRRKSGKLLAREAPVTADFVAAVPDSGIPAAIGFSEESGIPYGIALIKNRYAGRSFIQPSTDDRRRTVRVKLNPLTGAVRGKRVVLIDDSIVRGTTMHMLIARLREVGAAEVHVRIASPPVAYPCYFGIDTPYREELISSHRDEERVRRHIEADSLAFLSGEGLAAALGGQDAFCTGCFAGVYPVGAPIGSPYRSLNGLEAGHNGIQ
ncbi:MAG: amidophosphoribosyltransferase [Spirochaetaceae bacterium]|nr:amidophosphoribosyltransferase [Spirochaetaceae bacterium]MCF7949186.1 amidophosphoribosyltransferase [Spirochaetia bacterium]MCF7951198.1 amidophosphoribosyltransferase [Spirochaetaceae bacterium]